jgi:hypothetical protein
MTDQRINRDAVLRAAEATQNEIVEMMHDPALKSHLQRENGTGGVQRCVYVAERLVKKLAELPGEDIPEPPALGSTAVRRFIVEDETWYAHTTIAKRPPNVHAELSFDVRPVDDDVTGPTGEWSLAWQSYGKNDEHVSIRLTVYDEAWDVFVMSGFDEVMAAISLGQISGRCPSPQEVVEVLTRHGWVDDTNRELPERFRDMPSAPTEREALLETQQALCEVLAYVKDETPTAEGTITELTRVIQRAEAVTGKSFEPRKGAWH